MQNYYLIDFENVREAGLIGAEELNSDSHIYLFYTENANRLALDSIAGIDAEFRAVKVAAGRQSLDMHLVSFLGYIIGRSQENCSYTIISNDKGFDGTVAFWNASGLATCSRRSRISTAPLRTEKAAEIKSPATEKQVAKAKPERRDKNKSNKSAKNIVEKAEPDDEIKVNEPSPVVSANETASVEDSAPEINPVTVAEDASMQTAAEIASVEDNTLTDAEAVRNEEKEPVRKKTHRGGRGRGKKAKEQQIPQAAEIEATASSETPAVEHDSESKPADTSEKNNDNSEKEISVNPKIAENLRAAEVSDDVINSIIKIAVSCAAKKNVKQAVYREIIRRYGQKQGLEYYGIIKKNV